jgi:phosphoribosylamine---glycine ligase
MNILVIGNGAREQCIVEAFLRSPHKPNVYAYMKSNNPGILSSVAGIEFGSYSSSRQITDFARKIKADLVFVGMEEPLKHSVADMLAQEGVLCIGPKQVLAQLETSKSFTRNILEKYRIEGNPQFKSFTKETIKGAKEWVTNVGKFVVKADGLAGGKGVCVQDDHFKTADEGISIAEEMLHHHSAVVLEEKFEGEEFSLQCLTDGITVVPTPAAQDHKRAFEGDTGPNTGGMGSYSCEDGLLPFLEQKDIDDAVRITEKVAHALHNETGEYYVGVMYGGFMKTAKGVRLIEYNARFGDPETMNILPILKSDFVDVCFAMAKQKLKTVKVEFENKATVVKYIVPQGYPHDPVRGEKITVDENSSANFYYASVEKKEDGIYMTSSRAVAVVGIADILHEAERIAEEGCSHVRGKVYHRRDVGSQALVQKRVDHMKALLYGQQ